MGKKRARDAADGQSVPGKMVEDNQDGESSGNDEDFDIVNVEFEWFNYDPKVDYHGVKNLLRQLLDVDAGLINISALADLVLSQPTIGSTIKVGGEETDPYGMMTVLNMHEHRDNEGMKSLTQYITSKASAVPSLALIPDLLSSGKQIGLVIAERFVNLPTELSPPLYQMLIDEIEAAVEDKEPYESSHYLVMSKTWEEVESTLDREDAQPRKKVREEPGIFYFHLEDEVLHKFAITHGNYPHTKAEDAPTDSRRAFQDVGIRPTGHLILLESSKFEGAVKAINEAFGTSAES